jgi:hypothetical protein
LIKIKNLQSSTTIFNLDQTIFKLKREKIKTHRKHRDSKNYDEVETAISKHSDREMKGGGEIERWFVSTEKRKIDWEKHKGVMKRAILFSFVKRFYVAILFS